MGGEKTTDKLLAQLAELSRWLAQLHTVGEGSWRTRLEEVVSRQADAAAETFSSASDAVFILDSEVPPRIVECNEAASSIFGYDREEMVDTSVALLHVSQETMREFEILVRTALGGTSGPYCLPEFDMRRKNGSVFPTEHSVGQLFDQEGEQQGWVSVVRDISRDQGEAALRMSAAARDAVTGLPNRMLFYDRLGVALARAQRKGHRVAVMMLGVDRSKVATDATGRVLEDVLIGYVCERLKGVLRGSDTLARVGRGNFALLLEELDRVGGAGGLANRLLAALSEPYSIGGREPRIAVGIGVAIYPEDSEQVDGIVRRAHVAMYRALQEGRDNFQYYGLLNWRCGDISWGRG